MTVSRTSPATAEALTDGSSAASRGTLGCQTLDSAWTKLAIERHYRHLSLFFYDIHFNFENIRVSPDPEARLAAIEKLQLLLVKLRDTDASRENVQAVLTYLPKLNLRELALVTSPGCLSVKCILDCLRGDQLECLSLSPWDDDDVQGCMDVLQHIPEHICYTLQSLRLDCANPNFDDPDSEYHFILPHLPNLREVVAHSDGDASLRNLFHSLADVAPKVDSLEVPPYFPSLTVFLSGPVGRQLRHLRLNRQWPDRLRSNLDGFIPDLRTLCPLLKTFSAEAFCLCAEDVERLPSSLTVLRFDYYLTVPVQLLKERILDADSFPVLRKVEMRICRAINYDIPTHEQMESLSGVCMERGTTLVWPEEFEGIHGF